MKIINSIIILTLMCCTTISYGQDDKKKVLEFYTDYGYSNDLSQSGIYGLNFGIGESLIVDNRSPLRTRNLGLSYSQYLNPKNAFKLSFGYANYGFSINGRTDMSSTKFSNTYKVSYLEWGLSYVRRIPMNQDYKILIEPGVRYHSDGSPESNGISIIRKDAFSVSLYSGIETLMIGHTYFANIGLLMKFPVMRYNYNFDDSTSPYYPYFIGIRIGVNWHS